jgi:hypothetical protein
MISVLLEKDNEDNITDTDINIRVVIRPPALPARRSVQTRTNKNRFEDRRQPILLYL